SRAGLKSLLPLPWQRTASPWQRIAQPKKQISTFFVPVRAPDHRADWRRRQRLELIGACPSQASRSDFAGVSRNRATEKREGGGGGGGGGGRGGASPPPAVGSMPFDAEDSATNARKAEPTNFFHR